MRTPTNEGLTPDIVDGGQAEAQASGPERRCVLSGESHPSAVMLRLAIAPDGVVVPDIRARAPGRGAWVFADRTVLEEAVSNGHLHKALKRAFKGAALTIPADLAEQAEAGLRRQALDRLGLEMRAGKLVLGSDRIGEQARMGRLALLAHAADASEDGRKRLDQAWRVGREREGSGEKGRRLPLDREALSVALGRGNVVHLAVADAQAAARLSAAFDRLESYIACAASDGGCAAQQESALGQGGADDAAANNELSVEG